MKPFKFKPLLKPTIWGGNKITEYKGIKTTEETIGESWEISAVKGSESIVVCGGDDMSDKETTISELVSKYGERLVGKAVYEKFGTTFPLLVKFIDSKRDLSVQVHPNDELAKKRHNCQGKTEMWYIIDSEPGARIYAGMSKEVTPDDFASMAKTETDEGHSPVLDVIASHHSEKGDVFFLPAGRVHSIGAGNLLLEIQQTSDITYRIYDYGRRDKDGNKRQLHLEEARDAIDYAVHDEYGNAYDRSVPMAELSNCEYFNVKRIMVDDKATIFPKTDSFVIAICLNGIAEINGLSIHQGETVLVPAEDNTLNIRGRAEIVTVTMPQEH